MAKKKCVKCGTKFKCERCSRCSRFEHPKVIKGTCKDCYNDDIDEVKKTKDGFISYEFYTFDSSLNYDNDFTKYELAKWLDNTNFHDMYMKYVEAEYGWLTAPSIKSVDPKKPCRLHNLKVKQFNGIEFANYNSTEPITLDDLPKYRELGWFDKLVLESEFYGKTYSTIESLERAIRKWACPNGLATSKAGILKG